MIIYITDVIRYMKKFPYKGRKFGVWLRNCLYINWQKPYRWNIDVYRLYKHSMSGKVNKI